MRKTVYVILVLCCFIIKAYSINRPYYHFKQLSIKEGLPTSIISLYDDKNGSLWVGTTQGIYVSIRPRACFSPSYNKVKSQTKHVWLLTLL